LTERYKKEASMVEAEISSQRNSTNSGGTKSGENQRKLLAFIQREIANPDVGLVFTKENLAQAHIQIGSPNRLAIYDTLRALEKKGMIVRKKENGPMGGITVFMASPKAKSKVVRPKKNAKHSFVFSPSMTLSEVRNAQEDKINKLKVEIEEAEKLLSQIDRLIGGEK